MNPCAFDLPLTGNDFCQYYAPHSVYHPGIDLNKGYGDQDCGNFVRAPRAGTVVFVNNIASKGRGFGIFGVMKHQDGTYTRYAHLQETVLKTGMNVEEGGVIGRVGKTGTSYCHLHFEAFKEEMAQIQRTHTFPWCYYPVGKSEAWVRQYYLNPWQWLKAKNEIPEYAKSSAEKAKANGIIKDWSNPQEVVGGEKLEWILENLGIFDKSKHEGNVTLSRLAHGLDKMGVLDRAS